MEDEIKLKQSIDHINQQLVGYDELCKLLHQLPHRVSHPIMVPFGSKAFFAGELIHANEVLCQLGENYYAWRTTNQTQEIITRRKQCKNIPRIFQHNTTGWHTHKYTQTL
eukprot:c7028_g1_i1.p1 GENE.c7028_g1_i1~~c7028_g1_i1.p1  ORF type:complete len:110 (+),score=14.70 c7028_g1_i1:33-362(+)